MSDEPTTTNEEVVTDAPQPDTEETVSEQPEVTEAQETESNEEATTTEPENDAAQEESTEEAPEEKPPSRREQLRIQQLLKKYGEPGERPQAPSQTRQDALNYNDLEADPELIQQLETDRQATQQSAFSEGLKRAEFLDWKTSLKIDAPNIEKKHPILDPSAKEFHPAVADAVNNWYLNMSGFDPNTNTVNNPNIGYADFVEGFMELVQETAGQKNAQSVKNITKQAATTGLRPDGSSANRMNLNKDPSEMTTEELYAVLGQKPPNKK